MKIANKISLSFLFASLILVGIAGTTFYSISKGGLRNSIYNNLVTACCFRADNIKTYLKMQEISVGQLSKSAVLEDFLKISAKESPQQDDVFEAVQKRLAGTKETDPTIVEFLLLDKTGKVVASSKKSSIGLNRSTDACFLNGQKETYIKDVYYSETYKEPLMAVSTPFLDSLTGELLGVFVVQLKLADLNDIAAAETGMGQTGEIYIVNEYGYMITPSRFKKDTVLKQKVDTINVRQSLLHKDIEHAASHVKQEVAMGAFTNYRGIEVLGAYEYIPQARWSVLAEIEAKEAFKPLAKIRLFFIAILFLVPFAAWALGRFIAKLITGPLHKLHKGTETIGSGNLDYKVGTNAKDEVGQLSRAFDAMTCDLKKTTVSIEGLNKEITERNKSEETLRVTYEQLKEVKIQLLQSSKMASIGQLAGGVAHEINNPLTGVLNNVQLIKMLLAQKNELRLEDFREILNVIEESAIRCKNITQSLLEFSRASTDAFMALSLNEAINKIIPLIEHELKLRNIFIQNSLQPDLPLILGDFQLLQQVIFGVISNAQWAIQKKSGEEGGTITIKTQYESGGKKVFLFISDSGVGIPKENLEKIFDPFFTTKEVGSGTGLGLSIVFGIISTHKGTIAVESEAGVGSTFKISLPVILEV